MKAFFKDIEVNDETLALDDIAKVGANGSYLGTKHTRKYHKQTWYPDLFERGNYKDWESKGSKSLAERARQKVETILSEHQPEPLPDDNPIVEDDTSTQEETSVEVDPDLQSLTGQPWAWVAFTDPLQQFEIPNPENYVLEFSDDGILQVKADCNTAQGTYETDGSSINIELGLSTLAVCPEGSRSEEFLQKLAAT